MNNRSNFQEEILKFLESEDERIMMITGTHQYEKHIELLKTINKNVRDGVRVLFRVNSKKNLDSIFSPNIKNIKLNTKINLGNLKLYIDTMNSRTWRNNDYNITIMYPIDSICKMKEEQKIEVIDDLLKHTANKLFIVSWTDRYDYSWLDQFGIDRRVEFDSEEEDEEYHMKVLDYLGKQHN